MPDGKVLCVRSTPLYITIRKIDSVYPSVRVLCMCVCVHVCYLGLGVFGGWVYVQCGGYMYVYILKAV